jgi:hypothetical protein
MGDAGGRAGPLVPFIGVRCSSLKPHLGCRGNDQLDVLNLHGEREATGSATGSATGTVAQDRIRSAGPPARLVFAHLLVVAYYTYLDGRGMGLVAGAAGVVFVVIALGDSRQPDFDRLVLIIYPLIVAALAWLLDAAAVERTRASNRVLQLNDKSDAILTGVAEAVIVTSRARPDECWVKNGAMAPVPPRSSRPSGVSLGRARRPPPGRVASPA